MKLRIKILKVHRNRLSLATTHPNNDNVRPCFTAHIERTMTVLVGPPYIIKKNFFIIQADSRSPFIRMKSFTLKYFFVNLLIFLLFCCYLIFIAMLFLNENSNKTIAYKKNILFKKLKLRLNGCK
jgi:hypothetical protein